MTHDLYFLIQNSDISKANCWDIFLIKSNFPLDNVKKVLVQEGFAEQLANVVSTCKDATGDEILKQRTQSAADMIVMLLTEGQYLIFILLQLFIVVFVFILQLDFFANKYFLGGKVVKRFRVSSTL